MDKGTKQTLFKRNTNDQQIYEKVFNISSNQRNANQNYSKISPHSNQMAIIKSTSNNKCWQRCREKCTFIHCWWDCKLVQPLWKAAWRFLRKLGMDPSFDPSIPLLGLYPKDFKPAYYNNDSHINVYSSSIHNSQIVEPTQLPFSR